MAEQGGTTGHEKRVCYGVAMQLTELDTQALLDHLASLVKQETQCLAAVVAHLAEVDARRAYLPWASSLFVYATSQLHMAEGSAYKRITAARLVRRFPGILDALQQGEVHLSALSILSPHLTEANCAELLMAAKHKTSREVEALIAARFPQGEVPQLIRKLPNNSPRGESPSTVRLSLPAAPSATPAPCIVHAEPPRGHEPTRPQVEPLAVDRYKVAFTASKPLQDKLRTAQQLLSHRIPKGDLAAVLEVALDHLIDKLMHQRFATRRPASKVTPPTSEPIPAKSEGTRDNQANPGRYIPAPVRRQVIERDGLRCTHADPHGKRCTETWFLELHHLEPFGMGGSPTLANLTVRCQAHNFYAAQLDYGAEVMGRYRMNAKDVPGP